MNQCMLVPYVPNCQVRGLNDVFHYIGAPVKLGGCINGQRRDF
jgi:hypothetical protein